MSHPMIAILGAGPAGLTLGRLLQVNGIPFTIYEADADIHSRNQGGSLDLHAQMGQLALREAGLFEDFVKHSRPEGQASKLMRYEGHVFWDDAKLDPEILKAARGDEGAKPEIDREKLREMLLGSLEPGRVRWGCKVKRMEAIDCETGKFSIHFADGSMQTGIDLVVGADGAWSKARPLLTEIKPFYSGITSVTLWSMNVSKTNKRLSEFVGEGSVFMFDEGRAIIIQKQGGDRIRTYACLRQRQGWKDNCGIDWTNEGAAAQSLVDHHSRTAQKTSSVGVNCAMWDALTLAQSLVRRKDCLDDPKQVSVAVKEYEAEMFRIAKSNAEKTYKGLVGHFSVDGAKPRADMFKKMYGGQSGGELDEAIFN